MSLCGTGSIQERLTYAALPLSVLRSPAHENPADVNEDLRELVGRLTVEPLSNNSGYLPRKLSDEEAHEIAQKILSLFVRVMGGL